MTDTPPATGTSEVRGPFSAATTFTRATLAAPAAVDVVYDLVSQVLSVSFDPVTGAASYAVSVTDPAGAQVLSGSGNASPVVIPATTLALGTVYGVVVQAVAPGISGDWSPSVTFTPVTLTAPAVTSVTNDATTITVVFGTVTGANGYQVEVFDAAGAPLSPPLTATGGTSPVLVPAATLVSGQTYQVKVRAEVLTPPPGT